MEIKETISLAVGDTVLVHGHEYVLFYITETEDLEGRSGRIEFMDPLRAMRHMDEQRQRRAALEAQAHVGSLLPKCEKMMDEALS